MSPQTEYEPALVRSKKAEKAGFEAFWIAHHMDMDAYQLLLACGLQTSKIKLGTSCVNPVLTHPVRLAGEIYTLDRITKNRAILGIGSGDNSVYLLGLKAATPTYMEQSVKLIQSLFTGQPSRVGRIFNATQDVAVRLTRAQGQIRIPMYVFAEGRRNLQIAGRYGDGVVLGGGFGREIVDWSRKRIEEGAKEAGRRLEDLEIIPAGMLCVDKDRKKARDGIKLRVANRAHHNFRFNFDTVPPEHQAEVRKFQETIDKKFYTITTPIERIKVEEVPEYIVDRFCIAGTPEDCIEQIRNIEKAGINHIHMCPPTQGYDETLDMFIEEVMPAFK